VRYRYCVFCPPRFSNFFCLLLSPLSAPSPLPPSCVPMPAIPFLIPKSTVLAIHIEYIGTAAYIHHAGFPNNVQYNTSHMNSVNPFASRSSPDFLSSPFSAYFGRPIVSNQYSMPSAGADRTMYNMSVLRVYFARKIKSRSRRKKRLLPSEMRWTRLRTPVLRAASCFAAF